MSSVNRKRIVNELKSNFVIEASAGSGKTTILVERMVALVEAGVPVNEIVALTFTKKAANEFYDRFFAKLKLRSSPDFDKEKDDQYSCLNNPTKAQQELDKEALKNIDTCFLGTIDSFVSVILSEHPIDANIPSSSKIIANDEYNNILIDYYNRVIHGQISPRLEKEAKFFDCYVGSKYFVSAIKTILANRESKIIVPDIDKESLLAIYQSKFNILKAGLLDLYRNKETLKDDSTVASRQAWDALEKNVGIIKTLTSQNYKKVKFTLKPFIGIRFLYSNEIKVNQNFIDTFFIEYKKKDSIYSYHFIDEKDITKDIDEILYQEVISFLIHSKDIILKELHDAGKMSFKDAMVYAIELIRKDHDPEHGVIAKIWSKYKHYLVDEFQDDDLMQSELFFRITSKTIDPDWRNLRPRQGSLFFVGDPKQSIYHFRGADLSAYDLIKKHFITNKIGEVLPLDRNFRSKIELCDYYNNVFPPIFNQDLSFPLVIPGDTSPSNSKDKYQGAYWYDANKNDPEDVAKMVLDIKNNCLVNGKPINYKDFMIITSSKKAINNYIDAFSQKKIPCFAEGAININFSALLSGVIKLFEYLIDPNDNYRFVTLLASPLFNFNFSLTAKLDTDLIVKALGHAVYKNTSSPSIYLEFLLENKEIYRLLDYQGLDILVGVISLIKEEEMAGNINSFKDALDYVEHLKESEDIERMTLLGNEVDAVKVANVHKLKGLQSKIVIITRSGKNNNPAPELSKLQSFNKNELRIIAIKDQDSEHKAVIVKTKAFKNEEDNENAYMKEEEKRIIYVAGTRAKNIMLVAKSEKPGKWDALTVGGAYHYSISESETKEEETTLIDVETLIKNKSLIEEKNEDFNKSSYSVRDASKQVNESKKQMSGDNSISTLTKNKEDALVFGTMVHKLMEYIVKAKDIELDNSIVTNICNDYERPDLAISLEIVRATIYHGGFANQEKGAPIDIYQDIKKNNCYAETPYSYEENGIIHYGIIDLIIEKEDLTLIIDYKTDVTKSDHSAQLNEYKEAYQKATGKKAECHIYSIK